MKSNLYFPSLTGIRAIAAFCVFFHHYNQPSFYYPIFRILKDFHVGVTLLFVLSGFLICYRYYDTIEYDNEWFKLYLKNRMSRIYPMFFLTTTAVFVVALIYNQTSIIGKFNHPTTLYLLHISFLRGFFDDLKFTGISQGWSMTVEECFYFSAPFFFLLIKRNIKNIVFIPLILLSTGCLLVLIFSKVHFWGFMQNWQFVFVYTFFGRCIDFFAGIALGITLLKHNGKYANSINKTLIGCLIIAIGIATMAFIPLDEHTEFGLIHPIGVFGNNIILPIGVTLFLYGLVTENTWIGKFLSSPIMQKAGKGSYVFYLIHLGFIGTYLANQINWTMELFTDWLADHEWYELREALNHMWLNILVFFIILNIVSYILWRFIEEPINKIIRNSSILVAPIKKL